MSSRKQSVLKLIVARLIRGAVPVDGSHWVDPSEAAKARAASATLPELVWSPLALPLRRTPLQQAGHPRTV